MSDHHALADTPTNPIEVVFQTKLSETPQPGLGVFGGVEVHSTHGPVRRRADFHTHYDVAEFDKLNQNVVIDSDAGT